MSDKERPINVAAGSGGLAGEGGDGDENEPVERTGKGGGQKASLFRFWKGKRRRNRKKKQKGSSVNSVRPGRSVAGNGCCLCLKRPRRSRHDSDESPTSDPNSPEFTFDMLRDLIEKNDFVSKECNPHLDTEDK